jgi:hypothetical protein
MSNTLGDPNSRDSELEAANLKQLEAEIERMREMLCICLDRWIPFREVDLRRQANEAVGRREGE